MSTPKIKETVAPAATQAKPSTESPRVHASATSNKSFQGLPFLFDKQNYLLMGAGLVFIIVGYMLMSGGRSSDPNVFDAESLYSFRRITLAPVIILVGLAIEAYAIMKRPS